MKNEIATALGAARAAIGLAASHAEALRAFDLFAAEHSRLRAAGKVIEAGELRDWFGTHLLALRRTPNIGSLGSEVDGYLSAAQALGQR